LSRTCPDCELLYDDEVVRCPGDGSALVPSGDDPLVGRLVGSYRIERLLGKGGMGSVYLAEHPAIRSRVAVKFLHPRYARDAGIVERFFNEARAVNVIGHDNIVKILDLAVTDEGRRYLVMEYLQGPSLSHLLESGNAVPLQVAGPIVLQCCEALQAAHERGIVHRDLKPENVHLSIHKGRKNFVKLLDFGIAKLLDGTGRSTGQTRTGMVVGTPGYMSPDQAAGRTFAVDGRSDVFSLGVLMFQMATGRLPFPNRGYVAETGELDWDAPPPRRFVADVPQQYERIILRCLEREQDARFASMRDLHDAVEQCMKRLGIDTGLPRADASFASSGPLACAPSFASEARSSGVRPPRAGQLRRSSAATDPSWTSPARPVQRRGRASGHAPAKRRRAAVVAAAVAAVAVSFLAGGYLAGGGGRASTPADALAPVAPATVFLAIVSDPHGAIAEATWDGDRKAGITPFEVEVPKSTKVRVEFSKAGWAPYVADFVADDSRLVEAKLSEAPRPAAPPASTRAKKKVPASPGAPKPAAQTSAESKPADNPEDDLMDIVW
jgi:eukaryotic-like serine/threonine-protein kinase